MKTIRKFGCISAALAAITALACGAFFLFFSFGGVKNKAFAEDNALPPAELIVDFQSDEIAAEVSGNVTITGGKAVLKQGGAVAAKEKFLSFRLYVSAKIAGEMKISFGNVALICDENGFSAQGAAQTFHEKRALSGDVLIALTVSNGRIEAGVRRNDEPQERLYETAFKAVLTEERTNAVAPSFSAENGTAEISYFEIFSLETSVPAESEDYDPSHDSSAFAEKPVKEEKKKGCSGILNHGGTLASIAAVAAAGVVAAARGESKRQKNKNGGKK